MNRRDALKSLGLSVGYVVAAPTVIGLLQSCKTDVAQWTPELFSVDQGQMVTKLVDLILPTTESSPGALDVNVPEFLDLYVSKTASKENQDKYKEGLTAVLDELTVSKKLAALDVADYDNILAKYLRSSASDKESFANNPKEKLVANTLKGLRDRTVWAYRTSKKIGEEVLVYDPVPGSQIGCGDLQELTKGKRWSL